MAPEISAKADIHQTAVIWDRATVRDARIGKEVMIAMVGAGSVVTHDVPDGEAWAGNPARRIK